MRWYIIHTTPNYENKVSERIRTRAETAGLAEKIGQILIPSEEVQEMKAGQKKTSVRRLFPGYVFIELDFDDAVWHLVRKTANVTGFVGGTENRPAPMREAEIKAIFDKVSESKEKPAPKTLYQIGEDVRLIGGPFKDFNGVVQSVDYDKGRVRVSVTVFGRETPVDIQFSDIEKAE